MKGCVSANFPDHLLSVPWPLQCEASLRELEGAVEFAMASTSVSPQTPEEAPDSIHLQSMQPAFTSRDIFVHLCFHRV